MRNKVLAFLREQALVQPGDTLICAVSGGADSMALLWAMYLLREKLQLQLEAAHFNHNLRGEESQRDAEFVKLFCQAHGIPLHMGSATVVSGEKGLEAAAREARYAFLQTLSGKIATAHTADDNAETLLMHLVRGTGLKGLGGIAPRRENIIRPMLTVTRQEVLAFLEEEQIPYVEDSSNAADTFLRNRIRHHVMPLLHRENPNLAKNLSAAALHLREDEALLDELAEPSTDIHVLRNLAPALQNRALRKLLASWQVPEPEEAHVQLLKNLVYSNNPSAAALFPGGVLLGRSYDTIGPVERPQPLGEHPLCCPGKTRIPELGMEVTCRPDDGGDGLLAVTQSCLILRSRREGDSLCLSFGSKRLKKLFIDRKIPAARRQQIPVIADSEGVAAVYGIGSDVSRTQGQRWLLTFEIV